MLSRFRNFDPYRFVGPVNTASAPARTDRRTTRKRTVSDPACRMGGGVKPAFVCDRTDLLSGTNGCLRYYCSRRHDVAVWLCVSLRAPLCVCVRGNNCGASGRLSLPGAAADNCSSANGHSSSSRHPVNTSQSHSLWCHVTAPTTSLLPSVLFKSTVTLTRSRKQRL